MGLMPEVNELRDRLARLQQSYPSGDRAGAQIMNDRLQALTGFQGDSVKAEEDYNTRLAKLAANEVHGGETSLDERLTRLGLARPKGAYHVPEVRLCGVLRMFLISSGMGHACSLGRQH